MKLLRATLLSLFTVLILMMSSGFVVNKHYCGNELESAAFYSLVQPCEMQKAQDNPPPCHRKMKAEECHKKPSDDCCNDESDLYQTDQYIFDSFSWEIQLPVLLFFVPEFTVLASDNTYQNKLKYLPEESPPRYDERVAVLFQTFLL